MRREISIILIFLESVIVYVIVSRLILGPLFQKFYTGDPGRTLVPFATSYISLGIAVAYFTITLLIYPVLKFRDKVILDE